LQRYGKVYDWTNREKNIQYEKLAKTDFVDGDGADNGEMSVVSGRAAAIDHFYFSRPDAGGLL
jgi:hypothetical protein